MKLNRIVLSVKPHCVSCVHVVLILLMSACGKPNKTNPPHALDSTLPISDKSERQSYTRSADPATLLKFVQICQVNGVEPAGVISALFSEYIKRASFDGFYELYLERDQYTISGDSVFLKLVEDFLTVLKNNPQLNPTDFDFTKSTNFPAIDRKLRDLGFAINIQR